MQRRQTVVAVVLAATLTGCVTGCDSPALSVHPLYAPEYDQGVNEARIEGEWVALKPRLEEAGTESEVWLRVRVEAGEERGRYRVEVRPDTPEAPSQQSVTQYDLNLVALNGRLFFDGTFVKDETRQHTVTGGTYLGLASLHIVGALWVNDGLLRVSLPPSPWVNVHSNDTFRGSLNLSEDEGGSDAVTVITARTDDLRKFIELNVDAAGTSWPSTYLCRPSSVDCALRAFDHELVLTPDDSSLLTDAATFFLRRGSYERALELRRRVAVLEPDNPTQRSRLAETLMFGRDFPGARTELAKVERLDGGTAVTRDRMAWTYFLEARFAEAALTSAPQPANRPSVDSILLHYFSLHRLGRRSDASAYLQQQTRQFTGSREEHVLLAEIDGRVLESLLPQWPYPQGEPERRLLYFSALRDLTKGGVESARSSLAKLAKDAPNDSLIGLAARVEIDRLAAPDR